MGGWAVGSGPHMVLPPSGCCRSIRDNSGSRISSDRPVTFVTNVSRYVVLNH